MGLLFEIETSATANRQRNPLCLDSPSKHSYIGSFHMPPEKIPHQPCGWLQDKSTTNLKKVNTQTYLTMPDSGSRAVIAALKTLQEKMRRLELERQQAERNVQRFAHATRRFGDASSGAQTDQQLSSREGESSQRKELVSQLHSAEARCCLLEKQLDYMRKMVERAHKDKSIPIDREEAVQQNGKAPTHPQVQVQLEKLEKECVKLTNTQSEAERKIKLLELKLLEEEHQRKLVQEKAEELQRELDANLLTFSAAEVKPKKKSKSKAVNKKPVKPEVPVPQCFSKPKRMPFVAGTSTSPSHSVNANVQSVLHLLKTRQSRLCERAQALPISEPESRRSSRRDPESPSDGAAALGSLSELLLALQDELGQMSFEHQELVRQIDETDKRALREDLERELDCLVRRMEEKAAQITKLRKHQQTVQKLAQPSPKQKPRRAASAGVHRVQALPSSPVQVSPNKAQRHHTAGPERLQVLRDAQRLQSNLRRQDISWET